MGWARIAARAKAPLVPVSVAGSHLINPVLVQSPLLGWISGVRFLGEKWMPITLGQLLLAAGAGIATAFVAPPWAAALAAYFTLWNPAGAYFPLFPSKIRVKFGEVFPSPAGSEEAALRASYEQVSRAVQAGMDELLVG